MSTAAKLFHPFLALIASASEHELAKCLQYLKEENKILRARLPGKQVHTTAAERERLLQFGKPLGRAIEELMFELKGRYTIVIVAHNMAQSRRASDECIFMLLGDVIEHSRTEDLFLTPSNPKTAEYIEGRYG